MALKLGPKLVESARAGRAQTPDLVINSQTKQLSALVIEENEIKQNSERASLNQEQLLLDAAAARGIEAEENNKRSNGSKSGGGIASPASFAISEQIKLANLR